MLVRFGSFRGCTRGEAQYVCKSVPAVSHKFKSGLSVSKEMGFSAAPVHNVQFVKYDVTVSFMAQVLDTVAYFVSHVLVVDTVTYFDIFR